MRTDPVMDMTGVQQFQTDRLTVKKNKVTSLTKGRYKEADLSTKIPACTTWTMLRNRSLSSLQRTARPFCRVKVEANQFRTSDGTESDGMSLSSSSRSTMRL